MNSGDKHTPVEYFLWTKGSNQEGDTDRLIYYDDQGNYFEKPIAREHVEQTLALFDGVPRSVKRSSGGWIQATPKEIVIVEGAEGPKLQVRVEFADLKRGVDGQVLDNSYLIHQKIVDPEDLSAPIPLNLALSRRFVMDFGQGIIPIWVYAFRVSENGEEYAHFLTWENYLRALSAPRETKVSLDPFCVPKCCLRYEGSEPQDLGQKLADKNLQRLNQTGKLILPDALRTGKTLLTPGALSSDLLRHILCVWPKPASGELLVPTYRNLRLESEEELIPFGIFEGM